MPSRLSRRQDKGHRHFITFSCEERAPHLKTDDAKAIFETALESIHLLYDFDVVAYVVMPEHVHLLLSEPSAKPLGVALGVLKRSVSSKLSPKPLWLARYYDFNISTNKKLFEKIGYIHQNPVRRGLVEKAEDYRWSSFRAYALLEKGRVRITRAL